ncbi:MAG: hypothetical protein IJY24_01140 [Clostridia bacterium]|nr:hypothetical protein [Clostridia bacterium]
MLKHLLLYEKFELETDLTEEQIRRNLKFFLIDEDENYYGEYTEEGFFLAERARKSFIVGHSHNSFVPIGRAKIKEIDGHNRVSVTIRMNLIVHIMVLPFYWACLLSIFGIPFAWLLFYFGYFRNAKRLKEHIRNIVTVA